MICPVCRKGIGTHQRTAVLKGARIHLPCADRYRREERERLRQIERDRRTAIDRLLDKSETF